MQCLETASGINLKWLIGYNNISLTILCIPTLNNIETIIQYWLKLSTRAKTHNKKRVTILSTFHLTLPK